MVHEDFGLIEGSMGSFKLAREELRKQKDSGMLLPNRWLVNGDARLGRFPGMGYLIADFAELDLNNWKPRKWIGWSQEILDMIDQCTEPE